MKLELKFQINTLTLLLVANLVLFLIANFLLSMTSGVNQYPLLSVLGGFDYFQIQNGQLWLLITSGFLHFQILHFVINMYSLFRIGGIVSNIYGDRILYSTYILGALGGSLLTFIVASLEISSSGNTNNLFSVGASSSIFALVGLLVGGALRKSRYGFDFPFSLSDIIPMVIFSLIIGLTPGSNINNWAHLGGLGIGIVLGLIQPHLSGFRNDFARMIDKVLFYLAIIIGALSLIALIVNFIYVLFIK